MLRIIFEITPTYMQVLSIEKNFETETFLLNWLKYFKHLTTWFQEQRYIVELTIFIQNDLTSV